MGLRILTGLIGAPLLLLFIFKGGIFFAGLVFTLVTIGIWEYGKMVTTKGYQFQTILVMLSAWVMIITCYLNFKDWASFGLMLIFLCIFFLAIVKYPRYEVSDIAVHFLGVIYIGWTMSHLLLLNRMEEGTLLILYLFFAIWSSDSGAYFAGKFLGKHKLCPKISPKKSVEGSIGGVIGVVTFITLYCKLLLAQWVPAFGQVPVWAYILFGLACGIMSQVGDLTASLIKRHFGIKDYGKIFPGHGGVLDRFDSLIFVAPATYFFLQIAVYVVERGIG